MLSSTPPSRALPKLGLPQPNVLLDFEELTQVAVGKRNEKEEKRRKGELVCVCVGGKERGGEEVWGVQTK